MLLRSRRPIRQTAAPSRRVATQLSQADQARQSTEAGAPRRPILARRDEAGLVRHSEGRSAKADGEAVDMPSS